MLTLDELRKRFVYTPDKRDKWTVLNSPTGPLKGDCDDFALTALWIHANGSWLKILWLVLTFQAMLWFAMSTNGPHIILWVRNKGWIDNWYPDWGPLRHKKLIPYIFPVFIFAIILKR